MPLETEPLCNFCEDIAVLFCHDCNMHFCIANGCDDQVHAGKRHKKEGIQGATSTAAPLEEEAPVCEFCELSPSEVYCEDCCMYLCTANECLARVHKNAIDHEITSLFLEDGVSEYAEEEQEGPSQLRSQSKDSEIASQDGGATDELEPELSQLSIHSGGSHGDIDKVEKPTEKTPTPLPAAVVAATATRKSETIKIDPPKPSAIPQPKVTVNDLPRSLASPPLATKSSPVKLAPPKGSPPPPPTGTKGTSATKIVSNVVKRLVAPIKGTGTKEERLQRKEAVLAARTEPNAKLPYNTFGSKFTPEDAKGRRKPSLSFLKQPAPRGSTSSTSTRAPRTPSPSETKRGDIVITSVTTIRTTTTIRTEPKPKPPLPAAATTRARSTSNSSVTSAPARGSDLPSSWSVTDKNASPAAALPSSLFSPSSALPSPTASTARATPVRRVSLTGPLASPTARLSSSSTSSIGSSMSCGGRRSSTIQSPNLTATAEAFEYPAGLAPLGLKYVNAPEAGILIRGVTPGEAGERAGIQVGDVVKLLNRKAVRNMDEFQTILSDCKPTVAYKIAVVRNDKSVDLKLVL